MTFSTEKNKIFKIWNDSIENQFQIITLSDNDKIILSKTNKLNNQPTVYNNIINLSSDWIKPEFKTREVSGFETVYRIYKEYSVEINGININLIPYIESKISYRLGNSIISLPIPNIDGEPFDEKSSIGYIFDLNDVVEVNDTEEENTKNIIYRSSMFLQQNGLPEELELKFYINLINPIYYQST